MNRSLVKKIMCLVGALFLVVGQGSAQVIADYTFTGGSPASTDTDPNSTAGDFTISSAIASGAGFSGTSNLAFTRSIVIDGTNEATSIANDDYMSFTVTPTSGTLDLASLDLDYVTTAANAGQSFTGTIFVKSSVGGFTDSDPTLGSLTLASVIQSDPPFTFTPLSIDLSGASFQGLNSAVEFRVYFYDDNSANGSIHRLDNVVLSAVPEPSSYMLLGLGALSLFLLKRRHQQS